MRPEVLLSIEASLSGALLHEWRKQSKTLLPQIHTALESGDIAKAVELANGVDLEVGMQESAEYVRYLTYAAMILGATRVTDKAKDTDIVQGDHRETVNRSVQLFANGVIQNAEDKIRDHLLEQIAQVTRDDTSALFSASELQFHQIYKYSPDQTRDERGRFSRGRVFHPEAQSDGSLDVYHGTADKYIESIIKEGLVVKEEQRNYGSQFYEGARGESVYFTRDEDSARAWARRATDDGSDAVVMHFKLPWDLLSKVREDFEAGSGGAFYIPGGIPPDFLMDYTILRPHKSTNPNLVPFTIPEKHVLRKRDGVDIYAVVLCSTTVKKFNPHHEPAGSPKGGQFASKPASEVWGVDTPKPGEEFAVFRLAGADETTLRNVNAGNAAGVVAHIQQVEDWEKPQFATGSGDTVHAYSVAVDDSFGPYEAYVAGAMRRLPSDSADYAEGPAGGVGRRAEDSGRHHLRNVIYSFGEKGFRQSHLGSVPLKELEDALFKETGHRTFDDAGTIIGHDFLQRYFRDKLKVTKFNPHHDKLGRFSSGAFDAAKAVVEAQALLGGGMGRFTKSLGVKRKDMPQIANADQEEFIAYAGRRGIDIENQTYMVARLKPSQEEYNPENARLIPEEKLDYPFMVSADDYVLDGHNRWVRLVQERPMHKIKIRRIPLSAREALALMHSFPKSFSKDVSQVGATLKKIVKTVADFFKRKDEEYVEQLVADEMASVFGGYYSVFKFNPHHAPAGSPAGGQFTSAPGLSTEEAQRRDYMAENLIDDAFPNRKSGPALQPIDDKDGILRGINENVDWLTVTLDKGSGVASRLGYRLVEKRPEDIDYAKVDGKLVWPGVPKSPKRSEEKVIEEYGGHWDHLLDGARSMVAVDTLRDVSVFLKSLSKAGVEVVRAKNRFAPSQVREDGYRDILLNIRAANGHIVELQVHTKAMLYAKENGGGHAMYEESRKIAAKYTAADGSVRDRAQWAASDRRRMSVLMARSRALYNKVWRVTKEERAAPMSRNGWIFYECDNAYYRSPDGVCVSHVFVDGAWVPYRGKYPTKPIWEGQVIPWRSEFGDD